MSNTFYMMQDIEEPTAKEFSEFLTMVENNSEVTIQMLSHGGLVFAGLGISQMIKQAQSRGVVFDVCVYGIAASAASDIILSCDHIYMAPGSQIMIHSAWGGTDEGINIANSEQLALIRKRLPEYSEKDLEKDRWFNAKEAIELGLADGYIKENSESRAVYKLSAYLNPCMEDKKMADTEIQAKDEEIIEKKVDEEEKKEEIPEAECDKEPKAEDDMDVMEAVVRRLEEIEHRLAVLEGEGKKADDEMENASVSVNARRKALLAKLNAVCAPVQNVAPKAVVETAEDRGDRCKAVYSDFDALMADFIKRK